MASLHDSDDHKVFDCVIVITDQQLQNGIYQIEPAQGVVKAIDQDSTQLAEALIDGTKIIVPTLQKFPFVLCGLLHAAGAPESMDALDEAAKAQARAWEAEIDNRRIESAFSEWNRVELGHCATWSARFQTAE
jgi:type I restriction enzyme R subunit